MQNAQLIASGFYSIEVYVMLCSNQECLKSTRTIIILACDLTKCHRTLLERIDPDSKEDAEVCVCMCVCVWCVCVVCVCVVCVCSVCVCSVCVCVVCGVCV